MEKKMRQFKKITSISRFCPFFLIIFLFFASIALTADKVVVIPLFDEKSGPPAPIPRTGQTTSYETGDDGYFKKGAAWPNPRFEDNGDYTVANSFANLSTHPSAPHSLSISIALLKFSLAFAVSPFR